MFKSSFQVFGGKPQIQSRSNRSGQVRLGRVRSVPGRAGEWIDTMSNYSRSLGCGHRGRCSGLDAVPDDAQD